VTTVSFRIVKSHDNGRKAAGVDEIRLIPQRDEAFARRVQPLTSIGALVSYPRGTGGILLCQLRFADEEDPRTAQRKQRVLKTLLRNLGAEFHRPTTTMRPPVSPTAIGEPIAIAGATPFSGAWLGDATHSFAFAQGDVALRGMRFQVTGAMRAGEPTTITVGKRASALVFLHAASVPREFERLRIGRYRIGYADGRVVDVPVVAGVDVADDRQATPRLLPRAQLAWIGDRTDAGFAVAYARQWDNPTPEVAIERIEAVSEVPDATLALLAVTALPATPPAGHAR
jgi:hypothetical protein